MTDEIIDDLPATVPWRKDHDTYVMGVFGKKTLMDLYFLSNKGIIRELYGEVSRGKEASVFAAKNKEGKWVAVKIFKQNPSYEMKKYIRGDPRFEHYHEGSVIETWAKKEFKNLLLFEDLRIRVPHPLTVRGCVLVMEFIGQGPLPASTLKTTPPQDPEKCFKKIVDYMKKAHRGGIVHGDLSEYNIMEWGEPVIIDCGQSVISRHPNYKEFLERDIRNVVKYFSRLGVKCDESMVRMKVIGR